MIPLDACTAILLKGDLNINMAHLELPFSASEMQKSDPN